MHDWTLTLMITIDDDADDADDTDDLTGVSLSFAGS